MQNFKGFGLQPGLLTSLEKIGFETPTPIQLEAIPVALEGKDILGTAQTGTGKTGAYGIPLVSFLMDNEHACALVMTPTRELASQVLDMLKKLIGEKSGIKTALLIGGDSMIKQLHQLKAKPRLIIGTPGRINDHLLRKSLNLTHSHFLVLDETDRMLDMGFGIQIDTIIPHMPKQRQTLMFSATLPNNILKLSNKYLIDPVRISIGSIISPADRVKQEIVKLQQNEKFNYLLDELNKRDGSIIIFVKTKIDADRMANKLCDYDHKADAIHGDLRQNQRDRVIKAFRNQKIRVLIATDIAARGLDIPHIEHVINYDLPQCPEDYIHRIGRTARAGAEGSALNLVSGQDSSKWRAIHRLLNPGVKMEDDQRESRRPSKSKKFGKGAPRRFAKNDGDSSRRFTKSDGDSSRRFAKNDGDSSRRFAKNDGDSSRRFNKSDGDSPRRFNKSDGDSSRRFNKSDGDSPRRFAKSDGDSPRRFAKSDGDSSRRFTKSDGDSPRRFNKSDGDSSRRFTKSDGDSSRRFAKSDGDSSRRFAKSDGDSSRRFTKSDGDSPRRFAKSDGDSSRRFAKSDGDSSRRFTKSDGDSPRRFAKSDGDSSRRFAKSDGDSSRRFTKSDGDSPRRFNKSDGEGRGKSAGNFQNNKKSWSKPKQRAA